MIINYLRSGSFLIFPLLLLLNPLKGQSGFTFNSGSIKQKDYFSIIDYEVIKGKIFINATVNDKVHKFLVDTGAPFCITQNLYKELNGSSIKKINVKDQSGLADSLIIANVEKITIGGIDFENYTALVVPNSDLFECYEISGFIGSSLFRNSIISINSINKQLTLSNEIKKFDLKVKSIPMVLNKVQSSPYIWVKLKNKKKGRNQVLVDSGMDGLYDLATQDFHQLNSSRLFSQLHLGNGSNTIGLHGVAEDMQVIKGAVPYLTVGRTEFKNVNFQTTGGGGSRIGSDFFNYGITTLDYLNRKFYYEAYDRGENDLAEKTFPVSPTLKDEKLVIGIIWDNAYAQGLTIGDEILSIDELDYSDFDLCDVFLKTSPLLTRDKILLTYRTKDGLIKNIELVKQ